MVLRVLSGFFIGIAVLNSSLSLAQSEDERRNGFYQKQKENREFEQEREAGLKQFLKEQSDWEEQRRKDVIADKKRKKEEAPIEGGPEYKADRKAKYEDYEEYEKNRHVFIKDKKSHEPKTASEAAKREAWAMEEYGLDQNRPRFDIAKRNLYGKGGSSSSSAGGFSGGNNNSAPNFPPPPVFDDFGGEGYVPPPAFPPAEPFEPPPDSFPAPPVPFPEGGADFDGGGYFPPPPPPMPPPMEGDGF